jgi:AcrR family transcriptional regulator
MPKVIPEYKEAAKTKIIEAARKVFAEKGYHETTMNDIAKEIGVSKGALYSYFKSKEELLKEISLLNHQTLRDIVATACKSHDLTQALEEVYSKLTGKYWGNLHTNFEIVALASHAPKTKEIIMEDYKRDIETVQAFLEDKMKQGTMRTDANARTLAELFTSLYIGTMAKLILGFDSKEVHDIWIESMLLILGKTKPNQPS